MALRVKDPATRRQSWLYSCAALDLMLFSNYDEDGGQAFFALRLFWILA